MDNHGVALAGELEQRRQLQALRVLAGGPVGKDAVEREAVKLLVGILVDAADADVAEALALHAGFLSRVSG